MQICDDAISKSLAKVGSCIDAGCRGPSQMFHILLRVSSHAYRINSKHGRLD